MVEDFSDFDHLHSKDEAPQCFFDLKKVLLKEWLLFTDFLVFSTVRYRIHWFIKMIIDRQFIKDALGWGFILWLIGYALGILLFTIVPLYMIGWIIMPIGMFITIWVLLKKVKGTAMMYYVMLAIIWTLIAIVFDYFFLVKAFNPSDGYYKLDVSLYYALTFILPLIAGWIRR